MNEARESFSGWCVLELMGHRRLAGMLAEQNVGGAAFIRIDVPSTPPITQLYAPGAVYAITPCTEEVARAVAAKTQTDPVSLLGINLRLPAAPPDRDDEDDIPRAAACAHDRTIDEDCPECDGFVEAHEFEPFDDHTLVCRWCRGDEDDAGHITIAPGAADLGGEA